MQHLCSIIVVTLNEALHLSRMAAALSKLKLPPDVITETILVDGGSTDRTADLARELGFTKVIEISGANIPVCRNRGLAEARGDWMAFIDGDCEPDERWLEVAACYLRDARFRLIGWPVYPPMPGTWVQMAWHAHWMHKHSLAMQGHPVRQDAFRLITTRNMLFTRDVLTRVGTFDETLTTGEDTDFAFRAYTEGVEVIGIPDLKVIHYGEPATLRDFFRQQLWHANRTSYRKIFRRTGARIGGNVILFTVSFALSAFLGFTGLVSAAVTRQVTWLVLLVPLVFVLAGPALVIAIRARNPSLLGPLTVLYAAYGLARSLDLIGIARTKTSWKSQRK